MLACPYSNSSEVLIWEEVNREENWLTPIRQASWGGFGFGVVFGFWHGFIHSLTAFPHLVQLVGLILKHSLYSSRHCCFGWEQKYYLKKKFLLGQITNKKVKIETKFCSFVTFRYFMMEQTASLQTKRVEKSILKKVSFSERKMDLQNSEEGWNERFWLKKALKYEMIDLPLC